MPGWQRRVYGKLLWGALPGEQHALCGVPGSEPGALAPEAGGSTPHCWAGGLEGSPMRAGWGLAFQTGSLRVRGLVWAEAERAGALGSDPGHAVSGVAEEGGALRQWQLRMGLSFGSMGCTLCGYRVHANSNLWPSSFSLCLNWQIFILLWPVWLVSFIKSICFCWVVMEMFWYDRSQFFFLFNFN